MFSGVVKEVSCADVFVLVVVYYGGLEKVEGEKVENFVGCGILFIYFLVELVMCTAGRLPQQRRTIRPDHLVHLSCEEANAQPPLL